MKAHIALLFLCTALSTVLIAGCNKPQEISGNKKNVTEGARITDSDVDMAVLTVLARDETLKEFCISVVTTKGDVKLTGVVGSQDQINYANKLVGAIGGVLTIHNHLSVKTNGQNATDCQHHTTAAL